jgi:hypothetical protein
MRKLLIISILALSAALSASAQNRFGIMGGVNMSDTSTEGFSWRTGDYLGGLYDIQLTPSWYIQPQLIFSYEENKYSNSLTRKIISMLTLYRTLNFGIG